jgi:hypothetical protein
MIQATNDAVSESPATGNPLASRDDLIVALRQAAAGLIAVADKMQPLTMTSTSADPDALSPLEQFLEEGVVVPSPGADLATAEIIKVFITWCNFRDTPVPPLNEVRRALGPLLRERFGVAQSHSVPRGDGHVRGFRGIGFRPAET